MRIVSKVSMRLTSLREFYLFQKWGIPAVKQDKISKSILIKYLPANPVIIDCGAHDGNDSVEMVKILGGQVHAFEPVDDLFERLKSRTERFPNIICYNIALSNENGTAVFYVSKGSSDASSSLLEPEDHLLDHPDTRFETKTEVKTITLDDWAKQFSIPRVDMLWLDMQGFEVNMLKASERILETVSVIHTEVSTKETYRGVVQYVEYRQFLESKGFAVVLEAIPAGWDMGNVLFVRR